MKRKLFLIIIALFAFIQLDVMKSAPGAISDDLAFRCFFSGERSIAYSPFQVNGDQKIENSRYKFFFQPLSECFFYLLGVYDDEKIIRFLPCDFSGLKKADYLYKRFFVESGEVRLSSGEMKATFYFIVSRTPLKEVEAAVNEYETLLPRTMENELGIQDAVNKVSSYLKRLALDVVLKGSFPEKTVPISGLFIRNEYVIEKMSVKIETKDIYVRKIIF